MSFKNLFAILFYIHVMILATFRQECLVTISKNKNTLHANFLYNFKHWLISRKEAF